MAARVLEEEKTQLEQQAGYVGPVIWPNVCTKVGIVCKARPLQPGPFYYSTGSTALQFGSNKIEREHATPHKV